MTAELGLGRALDFRLWVPALDSLDESWRGVQSGLRRLTPVECNCPSEPTTTMSRYHESADVWREAFRRFPGQPRLGLDLGLCLEQAGDLEGAVSAGRDVLKLAPEDPAALNFLGYLFADHLSALVALLTAVKDEFALAPDAEVTTEANPESVDLASLQELRAAGYTRISLGMQSVAPEPVLQPMVCAL